MSFAGPQRMVRPLVWLFALSMMTRLQALGLGDIQLDSVFGEPFSAVIPVLTDEPLGNRSFQVALGSDAEFRARGIDRSYYLTRVRVEFDRSDPQNPVIRLTGSEALVEPYLQLLVQIRSANGAVQREFVVLPPIRRFGMETNQVSSAPVESARTNLASETLAPVYPDQPVVPARFAAQREQFEARARGFVGFQSFQGNPTPVFVHAGQQSSPDTAAAVFQLSADPVPQDFSGLGSELPDTELLQLRDELRRVWDRNAQLESQIDDLREQMKPLQDMVDRQRNAFVAGTSQLTNDALVETPAAQLSSTPTTPASAGQSYAWLLVPGIILLLGGTVALAIIRSGQRKRKQHAREVPLPTPFWVGNPDPRDTASVDADADRPKVQPAAASKAADADSQVTKFVPADDLEQPGVVTPVTRPAAAEESPVVEPLSRELPEAEPAVGQLDTDSAVTKGGPDADLPTLPEESLGSELEQWEYAPEPARTGTVKSGDYELEFSLSADELGVFAADGDEAIQQQADLQTEAASETGLALEQINDIEQELDQFYERYVASGLPEGKSGRPKLQSENLPGASAAAGDDSPPERDADELLVLVDSLLKRRKFELKYQPLITLRGEQLLAYEANLSLVRSVDQSRLPERFIQRLFTTDRASALDEWIFDSAIATLETKWQLQPNTLLFLRVTTSSLKDPDFLRKLRTKLQSVRFDEGALVLQISESDMATHPDVCAVFMQQARHHGFGLCLYGLGSSAEPLQNYDSLDVDFAKLDVSISVSAQRNEFDMQRLEQMLSDIHGMHCKVIVPAVEVPEFIETARKLGADYLQGHYFFEPTRYMEYKFPALS